METDKRELLKNMERSVKTDVNRIIGQNVRAVRLQLQHTPPKNLLLSCRHYVPVQPLIHPHQFRVKDCARTDGVCGHTID